MLTENTYVPFYSFNSLARNAGNKVSRDIHKACFPDLIDRIDGTF